MAETKFPMHVSPVGTASWPWLNKPDVRFDADGIYHVKLVMTKEESKKLDTVIKPLMNGGKHNPLKPEKDDQGNNTDNMVCQFKMKSVVKSRKGDFTQVPILLDKEGQRIESTIGAGSKIKVAYQAVPFDQGGGGVTLRLRKVRVLDLVEYQGGSNDDLEWGEEFSQGSNDKDEDADGEDF
jgi:hypothetical protein